MSNHFRSRTTSEVLLLPRRSSWASKVSGTFRPQKLQSATEEFPLSIVLKSVLECAGRIIWGRP